MIEATRYPSSNPFARFARRSSQDYYKVSFSTVEVKEYKRDIGFWSVPGIGTWPLGLSTTDIVSESWGDIDTFEYR